MTRPNLHLVPPVDYDTRPLPSDAEWQDYLAKVERDSLDPAGDLWIPAAIFGIITFVGAVAFYIGTMS